MATSQQPVVVSMHDLEAGTVELSSLEMAFGPSSLGVLIVKDLPEDFGPLRMKLLSYASYLAHLPSEELEKLENAASYYNVGWSHGKEALTSGKYDTMKGSYYAGVMSSHLQDASFEEPPHFALPNIWPPENMLPGFRDTFQELCTLIIDVAILVARACDEFAAVHVQDYVVGQLERIVKESISTKARLLHYYPESSIALSAMSSHIPSNFQDEDEDEDSWCAMHVDDGCLTGLTSALYIDESHLPHLMNPFQPLTPYEFPDPLAGLYIRSRTSETVKVNIPADCLAFQTGSALELMTGGALKAVPHFVRGTRGVKGKVARNTLAVFTQPNLEEIVELKSGLTFGEHIRLSDESHA